MAEEAAVALTVLGVDYAWAKPNPAGLRAAGYKFAMRYLSHDPTKDLSAAELRDLWANQIKVGLVWETTAHRALFGRSAGVADATAAKTRVEQLGLNRIPIYFAADWDVTPGQKATVAEYMRGVESVIGRDRTGVYGGYWIVKHLAAEGVCSWYWQTYAWSGGHIHPKAHIFQWRNGVRLAGGTVDLNKATDAASGFGVQGPLARSTSRQRARWRTNVKVLDRILRAHPRWPRATRYALARTRERYRRLLERSGA